MIGPLEFLERHPDLAGRGLSPVAQEAVQQHLAGCPACREYVERYRLLVHVGGEAPCPPLPAHLRALLSEQWQG